MPLTLVVPQIAIVTATLFLASRQTFCVLANLTTNELLMRAKYSYLKGPDGFFRCEARWRICFL